MKRILVLGVCALFIACSSSSEKSSDADTSTSAEMDTVAMTSPAIDTTNAVTAVPVAPVETAESKVTEVKTKETPAPKEVKQAEPVKPAAVPQAVDTKKGETLISKSDCFACHKLNEKLLGPSYKDVANKYSDTKTNIDYLVKKIKAGGSGVWGAIPMSPHPALSDEDVEAMVHYILSVK